MLLKSHKPKDPLPKPERRYGRKNENTHVKMDWHKKDSGDSRPIGRFASTGGGAREAMKPAHQFSRLYIGYGHAAMIPSSPIASQPHPTSTRPSAPDHQIHLWSAIREPSGVLKRAVREYYTLWDLLVSAFKPSM
ncbi:MAG: hypothetical protein Q6353_010785 [Candidatus Sigynarchaeum springense]